MTDTASLENAARLVEQVSRVIHTVGHREGLFPAQWAALRYFQRAPTEAHTVAGLARYQRLQGGTVARTVRVLMEKGLLRPRVDQEEAPGSIDLTPYGLDLLRHDPLLDVCAALKDLPPDQFESLVRGLTVFLGNLEAMRRGR